MTYLYRNILAGDLGPKVVSPTRVAQVGIALPHSQIAGALLGVAGGLAPAPREPVVACNDINKKNFSRLVHKNV